MRFSKDQIPVIIHDKTVNRTTEFKGNVSDFSSGELKKMNIPTLSEVFDLVFNQVIINIEIKEINAAIKTLHVIEKYIFVNKWDKNNFIISSLDWKVLKLIRDLNSTISLAVLTENPIEEAIVFAKKIKAKAINPNFKLLNKENVTLMHQNGFQVFPWTVNKISDIILMKTFNVDGIISDFPDRI